MNRNTNRHTTTTIIRKRNHVKPTLSTIKEQLQLNTTTIATLNAKTRCLKILNTAEPAAMKNKRRLKLKTTTTNRNIRLTIMKLSKLLAQQHQPVQATRTVEAQTGVHHDRIISTPIVIIKRAIKRKANLKRVIVGKKKRSNIMRTAMNIARKNDMKRFN